MTPAFTFFIGLAMLVLFGWYFATDQGPRKRLLAMTLMLLLVVFSIATIWPPQKKRQQQQQRLITSLKTGDRVVTNAGIHGLISNVKENTVLVKVADNVKIEMDKSAITNVLKES